MSRKYYKKKIDGEAKVAYAPSDIYPISDEMREMLFAEETVEECEAYFAHIEDCIEQNICSECGQPVNVTSDYMPDNIKEYSISGLCKTCQIKAFGI